MTKLRLLASRSVLMCWWLCVGLLSAAPVCAQSSAAASAITSRPQQPDVAHDVLKLKRLIVWLSGEKRWDDAITAGKQLVTVEKAQLGPEHAETATALDILGALYRSKPDYAQAKPIFEQALRIHRKTEGPASAPAGTDLFNLGLVQQGLGDATEALALYQQALAIYDKQQPRDDHALISVLRAIEDVYLDRKDYARLEPLFLRSLALCGRAYGPESAQVVMVAKGLGVLREELHDYAGAAAYYQRAVDIAEKAKPAASDDLADALSRLAAAYRMQRQLGAATAAYQRACALFQRASPVDDSKVALCTSHLGSLAVDRGDYRTAEPLLRQALQMYEHSSGANSADYARALSNWAICRDAQGDPAGARALFERTLKIMQAQVGAGDPDLAVALKNLAGSYRDAGDYARAEPLYLRAVAINEANPDSATALASSLGDLALLRADQGQFAASEAGYTRALGELAKASALESIAAAQIMGNFGSMYQDRADYARARDLDERALALTERALGPTHPDLADALNNLGDLEKELGNYERADRLYRRAQTIWVATFGKEHRLAAVALNNLGALDEARGDYGQAEQTLLSALALTEKTLGAAHPDTATSLNNLAGLASVRGDFAKAEGFYSQALAIWEKALGPSHPKVALGLNNLGTLYVSRGESARAQPLFARAEAIAEQQGNALALAHSRLNLAGAFDQANDFQRAEPLCRSALTLFESSLGPQHALVASALNQLASIRLARGDSVEAEALLRRAVEIAGGKDGNAAEEARYLAGLTTILTEKGMFDEAEQLLDRAARLSTSSLGPTHPDAGKIAIKQGLLYWAKGDASRAVSLMQRGLDIAELHVSHTLTTGSEQQRRLFLEMSETEANWAVSLHARAFPTDTGAMRLALLSVLRRKGRLLDTMSRSIHVLRQHLSPDSKAMFDQLSTLRSGLAQRALAPSSSGGSADEAMRASAAMEQRAEQLEQRISAQSSAFRVLAQSVTLERVAAAIPRDGALLEIVSYLPFDPRAHTGQDWGTRRYAAYLLDGQGKVDYADLGESAPIDRLVAQFRQALADPRSDARAVGRALDERLMQPVRRLLPVTRHLLIAPDGELNLIPFAALVDERGHYLIDDWAFSYLSTGRDLLRGAPEPAQTASLVVANPDYGPAQAAPDFSTDNHGAFDLREVTFDSLPGTEAEGRAVASELAGAALLVGPAATTHRLMQVKGPRVLHIATHGFFLGDVDGNEQAARALKRVQTADIDTAVMPPNPLLRAGLAFASANLHRPGDEGILTALEASSLDLWGTKLVVLSACDTAVGEVRTGEGVYGLRRAFTLAGAESLVMSLWRVNDMATRDLMTAYYRSLAIGEGRAQGLRLAQLALSRNAKQAHPYYWASFVEYGADTPLDGKVQLPPALGSGIPSRAQLVPLPSSPALRGCSCRLVNPRGADSLFADGTAWLLLAFFLRRRKAHSLGSRPSTRERSQS